MAESLHEEGSRKRRQYVRPGGQPFAGLIRKTICCTALPAILRHAHRHDFTIVTYHGVIPDDRWQGWTVADMAPLSLFKRQLSFYRRHYNVIPLSQMVNLLTAAAPRPPRKMPEKCLAITFDDGYRNNLNYAVPALANCQLPATFFVTTGFIQSQTSLWWLRLKQIFNAAMKSRTPVKISDNLILPTRDSRTTHQSYRTALAALKLISTADREPILSRLAREHQADCQDDFADIFAPMSWDDVAGLHRRGFDVGAHTVSHPILSRESPEIAAHEIRQSVNLVRQRLGIPQPAFSYPNGQWDDFSTEIQNTVRDAGCCCAVSSVAGTNRHGENMYALRRISISGIHSLPAVELETCRINHLLRTIRHPRSLIHQT